jgi:hypothetical protein
MTFEMQAAVIIPTDTLLGARLKELEHKIIPYTDRKTGEEKTFGKLNWVFEIAEQGELSGKTVRAETSDRLDNHPNNRFRAFAEALLQREIELGVALSESDLIGLPCLITTHYEDDRSDKTKQWQRVNQVYPVDPASAGLFEPPF